MIKEKEHWGGAENHYSCMSIEDIKNLKISDISDENSILFLWVVFPLLQEGLDVIKAWGFKYKTLGFSWIKTNEKSGTPFFGIGHYTKSNCEVCLIGIKGKPEIKSNSISSVIIDILGEHSAKPDIVREKIVELMGDVSRVELFARDNGNKNLFGKNRMDGWDTWGNEVKNDLNL